MYDRSQDITSSILSVDEDLTEAMKVTSTVGRLFTELVKPAEIKKPSSISGKTAKTQTKFTPNLRPVRQSNSVEEMVILLSPLISERFTFSKFTTKMLRS